MAELVDAADLKSVGRKAVGVQVPPWALFCNQKQKSAEGSKVKAFSRSAKYRSSLLGEFILFHPNARKRGVDIQGLGLLHGTLI